jgi:hypothetical protein
MTRPVLADVTESSCEEEGLRHCPSMYKES